MAEEAKSADNVNTAERVKVEEHINIQEGAKLAENITGTAESAAMASIQMTWFEGKRAFTDGDYQMAKAKYKRALATYKSQLPSKFGDTTSLHIFYDCYEAYVAMGEFSQADSLMGRLLMSTERRLEGQLPANEEQYCTDLMELLIQALQRRGIEQYEGQSIHLAADTFIRAMLLSERLLGPRHRLTTELKAKVDAAQRRIETLTTNSKTINQQGKGKKLVAAGGLQPVAVEETQPDAVHFPADTSFSTNPYDLEPSGFGYRRHSQHSASISGRPSKPVSLYQPTSRPQGTMSAPNSPRLDSQEVEDPDRHSTKPWNSLTFSSLFDAREVEEDNYE